MTEEGGLGALTNRPFLREGDAKRACLFLHGLGGGIYELEPLAARVHARGFTVSGFNYPGHDAPVDRMPASRWEDWYARVEERYRALRDRGLAVSVVGFSTGCQLALLLASEQPVERLVLLSPYVRIRHRWYYGARPEAYLKAVGTLVTDVPRRPLSINDRAMRAEAKKVVFFRTFNLAAVRSAIELIDRVRPRLASIRAPALVMQSVEDGVVDPAGAEDLHDALGSTERELHWLRRSDHVIGLDVEREVVFKRVTSFLEAR
ncbi:MAG: alpha/beta fold hydrolase [Byssovorax sp.]